MHLVDTATLKLKEFPPGKDIPKYAILSHTWGDDEVLFADLCDAATTSKAGYAKLRGACFQAVMDGFYYIWIDTCCINKDSSSELSEALKSMYRWYQQASICYVYLEDFPHGARAFTESRWFTRGWTLQELIGPAEINFYTSDWVEFGTKSTFLPELHKRTGIDVDILSGDRSPQDASVAKRMSWASTRETTRTEDRAYCLMGLFDVTLPLLYGEGVNAFIQLQEQILKTSDDHSLFAWSNPEADSDSSHGLLAVSPAWFKEAGHISPYRDSENSGPYSMTNKGLQIGLRVEIGGEHGIRAFLECHTDEDKQVVIFLHQLSEMGAEYTRVEASKTGIADQCSRVPITTIQVKQSLPNRGIQVVWPSHEVVFHGCQMRKDGYYPFKYVADNNGKFCPLSRHARYFKETFKISKRARQLAGAILFRADKGKSLVVLLGSLTTFSVGFDVVSRPDIRDWAELSKIFEPHDLSTALSHEGHVVRIDVAIKCEGDTKSYMVDIDIEPLVRCEIQRKDTTLITQAGHPRPDQPVRAASRDVCAHLDFQPPVRSDFPPPVPLETRPPVHLESRPPIRLHTRPPTHLNSRPLVQLASPPPIHVDSRQRPQSPPMTEEPPSEPPTTTPVIDRDTVWQHYDIDALPSFSVLSPPPPPLSRPKSQQAPTRGFRFVQYKEEPTRSISQPQPRSHRRIGRVTSAKGKKIWKYLGSILTYRLDETGRRERLNSTNIHYSKTELSDQGQIVELEVPIAEME